MNSTLDIKKAALYKLEQRIAATRAQRPHDVYFNGLYRQYCTVAKEYKNLGVDVLYDKLIQDAQRVLEP